MSGSTTKPCRPKPVDPDQTGLRGSLCRQKAMLQVLAVRKAPGLHRSVGVNRISEAYVDRGLPITTDSKLTTKPTVILTLLSGSSRISARLRCEVLSVSFATAEGSTKRSGL